MHYMGDRRTGRQLLQDAAADAAAPIAALARRFPLAPADPAPANRPGPGGGSEAEGGGGCGGGYAGACGGRGLLYGMAAAVERLTGALASAEPEGLGPESWARAVRDFSKWP